MSVEIGKLLRARRLLMDLSQTQVALKLGLEYKTIWRIESGLAKNPELIARYALLLGLRIETKLLEK